MREFSRVLTAFAVVIVFYFTVLYVFDLNHVPCPAGDAVELKPPFNQFVGQAYATPVPLLENFSDSLEKLARSTYTVCENNNALWPPHSVHMDIARLGHGRYSHWAGIGFIFSSSDNTNPNTNGRRYFAVSDNRHRGAE